MASRAIVLYVGGELHKDRCTAITEHNIGEAEQGATTQHIMFKAVVIVLFLLVL